MNIWLFTMWKAEQFLLSHITTPHRQYFRFGAESAANVQTKCVGRQDIHKRVNILFIFHTYHHTIYSRKGSYIFFSMSIFNFISRKIRSKINIFFIYLCLQLNLKKSTHFQATILFLNEMQGSFLLHKDINWNMDSHWILLDWGWSRSKWYKLK